MTVLFACTHNAGRSQMAAAICERHGGGRVRARSAGTAPAAAVHPVVVEAMRERGIELAGRVPRLLTPGLAGAGDLLVTMGCGESCPVVPGVRVVDWPLDDPAGQPLERVRAIRDEIERRVVLLIAELARVGQNPAELRRR